MSSDGENTKKPEIDESVEYDNFLERVENGDAKSENNSTLETFLDEHIDTPVPINEKKRKNEDVYAIFKVHFRNVDDLADFCRVIGQVLYYDLKETFYPIFDRKNSLFDEGTNMEMQPKLDEIDHSLIAPKKRSKGVGFRHDAWQMKHWRGMPEFFQPDNKPFRTVTFKFRTKEDLEEFGERIGQKVTNRTIAIWHPLKERPNMKPYRWIEEGGKNTLPRHPIYIVSKGRSNYMTTSKSLSRMGIPHYIIIEPQDEADYEAALDRFNLRDNVTLLVAPFSNHGDGPGRARNWAWDHAISIGAEYHWVMDDNIYDFFRLNRNFRVRFETGLGFRLMEEFVERYQNVKIAGPNYFTFVQANEQKYPFTANTRVYSCILIKNDCQHRWRGRYNEDTDLCLRVLKDGDCVIQFNAFLQDKAITQSQKGGNTKEFYHSEGDVDEEGWSEDGTINKSKMLVEMHPDVASIVWKFNRWHHYVDYTPFENNKLIYKDDFELPEGYDEHGFVFVDDWDYSND